MVSEPGYVFANMIFEGLGAELIRVDIDDNGMCTDMMEDLLLKHDIKLLMSFRTTTIPRRLP